MSMVGVIPLNEPFHRGKCRGRNNSDFRNPMLGFSQHVDGLESLMWRVSERDVSRAVSGPSGLGWRTEIMTSDGPKGWGTVFDNTCLIKTALMIP